MGRKHEREDGLKSTNAEMGLVSGKTRSGKRFKSEGSCSVFANGGKDGSGSGGGPGIRSSPLASRALRSEESPASLGSPPCAPEGAYSVSTLGKVATNPGSSCGKTSVDLGCSVQEALWVEIHDLWVILELSAVECKLASGEGVSSPGSSAAADLEDGDQNALWVEIQELWIALYETALDGVAEFCEDMSNDRIPRHGVCGPVAGSANDLSANLPSANDSVQSMPGLICYGKRLWGLSSCSVLASGRNVGILLSAEEAVASDVCSKLSLLVAASNPILLPGDVDLGRSAIWVFDGPAPRNVSLLVRWASISVGSVALSTVQSAPNLTFIKPKVFPGWKGVECSECWLCSVWITLPLLLEMRLELWKEWAEGSAPFKFVLISGLLSLVSGVLDLVTSFPELDLHVPTLVLDFFDPYLVVCTPNMKMEPHDYCWAGRKLDLGALGFLKPYSFRWSKWFYNFWQRSRSSTRKDRSTRMLVASTGCFKPKLIFFIFDSYLIFQRS